MGGYMTENELTAMIKQLNLKDPEELEEPSDGDSSGQNGGSASAVDGWLEVKRQTIVVRDPIGGGKPATVRAESPVKLKVNDVEISTETAVFSTDRIQWEIETKPLFEILVSEDELTAYFHLHSKERYDWRLMDAVPSLDITLIAEEDKDTVVESLHFSHVFIMLEHKSIKANLDVSAIQQEIIQPTYKPVVVARGKPTVPGTDAKLETYFPQQVESRFFEIDGTVDFRNHLQIPSVKKGEVIAKKIPMVDGVPGYNVYGDVIVPPPPNDVIVVVKSHVELTPDGEVIALRDGRPRMTGRRIKAFDISTAYIVAGDVDIETGNIVFSGDVIVYGNVTDSMIIETLGNVYVYGSVYNATITATGSIFVRGTVIGSRIYSGYFGVMFNRLYKNTKWLSDKMEQLHSASLLLVRALEQKKQPIRWGQLLLLLIENKFNDIPGKIKELQAVIANLQHLKKEEFQKIKERSTIFLHPHRLVESAGPSFIQGYISLLRDTYQEVERMQEAKVKTVFNQCHNSELKSNGEIVILREGIVLSNLYSAGNIIFKHNHAVCRGSVLEAEGGITAKNVGGQTGSQTLLKAKRFVSVQKMLSGRVCVGNYCVDIHDIVENKTFTINSIRRKA